MRLRVIERKKREYVSEKRKKVKDDDIERLEKGIPIGIIRLNYLSKFVCTQ